MIVFDSVRIRYSGTTELVASDVSFRVPRGTVTALVGPNGSGKSTLVRALIRRVALESGQIRIDDVDLAAVPALAFARQVAVVTQREDTTFQRRVAEYIMLGRFPHGGSFGAASRPASRPASRAVADAASRAGVEALLDRNTDELSGGEWQRVRIARALAQGGHGIVLDEPTSFLDIGHEMQIFQLAAALAESGAAVLLVSHQLNLVARFASTMVLLDRGVVAAVGSPNEVMRGELLERVYDWPLVVTRDPAVNAPALVPLRKPN